MSTDPTNLPGMINGDELAVDSMGVKVAVDAAVAATEPHPLPESGRFVITTPPGSTACVVDIDERFEAGARYPRRRRGTFTFITPESLAEFVTRHEGLDTTEVWADFNAQKIVAVLNAHEKAGGPVSVDGYYAGWGDHRAEFTATATPEWQTWLRYNGEPMSQVAFAEFIEDNLLDVVAPEPTTMLEMVQTFDATSSVVFRSQNRLQTGERELVYKESLDASAGSEKLTVPDQFTIAVQPFEGADKYRLTARLSFTIREGKLTLKYKLERPRDVLREAFNDVVTKVKDKIPESVPIFHGTTAAPATPLKST